jgi:hypothetical protein
VRQLLFLSFLILSLRASADPETPAVPQCTVHMFPTKPLHTVMAAADAFAGLFGPEAPAPAPGESPEDWARAQFEVPALPVFASELFSLLMPGEPAACCLLCWLRLPAS